MGCGGSTASNANRPVKGDVDDETLATKKPAVFFVLGGPGSGKGTQCEKIRDDYHVVHLSAGDLLREEQHSGSELAKDIQNYIANGKLVPGEVTVKLIEQAMRKRGWGKNQYLIDGFPRSQDNLDHFNKILGEQVDFKFVLFYECSFETMEKRIMERGKTSGRDDDNAEALKKRFETYNESTKPIVEHFEKENKLKKISAEKSVDEVYAETKKILDSQKGTWTNKGKKSKVLFINGGPGSGKGTQCDKIKLDYNVKHLSVGDLLREEVRHGSPLAKEIEGYQKEGKLVPSAIPVKALKNALLKENWGTYFLVDGFPRNQENQTEWDKLIGNSVDVLGLLLFECSAEEMEKRILERGKTSGRSDDNAETVKKRVQTYNEETKVVLEIYEKKKLIHKVSAEKAPDEVYKTTQEELNKLKFPLLKK